jgi:hypothetical protein
VGQADRRAVQYLLGQQEDAYIIDLPSVAPLTAHILHQRLLVAICCHAGRPLVFAPWISWYNVWRGTQIHHRGGALPAGV